MPAAPRQTELHRHLDVAVRTSTLLELGKAKGLVPQSTSLEAFAQRIHLRSPLTDLKSVLDTFLFFPRALTRPEDLERIARECVEDCFAEGTLRAELRYSPSFLSSESHLDWETALGALERGVMQGLARCPGMSAGLLCIVSREYGMEACAKTVEFFLKNRDRFLGIDLAGDEGSSSPRVFEQLFKPVRAAGACITIHAGEAAGPENIWEAIEHLGASRIGHGIHCVDDPKLMRYLADHRICLEVCPSSNWLTRCVPSLEEHPLPQILRAGIPVCINTDDPGVFNVTLPSEIEVCRTKMGLTASEIRACLQSADDASFLNARFG